MFTLLKYLIAACTFVILVATASTKGAPQGFLEGHLKIVSPRPVELDDASAATATVETHAEYSLFRLIILSKAEQKEIARVTPERDGNYRVSLPPGDYILDVAGRRPNGHLRARPQPFTILSDQTVRVDMSIELDHSQQ
jgi:hypothetical protein